MGDQQAESTPMNLVEALRICLEHAKAGRRYGVRSAVYKGLVYGWQCLDGKNWELHHTDAETEIHDDTIVLEPFEVLTVEQIKKEWPI